MSRVAGVDGCATGWVVVEADFVANGALALAATAPVVYPTFADVIVASSRCEMLSVDIPIGLLDVYVPGGRQCDRLARGLLGRPRSSSVFSPPTRAALRALTFPEAYGIAPLTQQAFGLTRKIAEVDALMTPQKQETIVEFHPEVTFSLLRGAPAEWSKRKAEGIKERERALASVLSDVSSLCDKRPVGVELHDLLDACAGAWTAARVATQRARRIPESAGRDAKGLRMEIWG